ncbi:hypothetical protein JM47_01160 [Ureaplasma diversum]|uniref:Uncharacterized protein n=1 Tax=Ureaplasma diversum TaxID=42094 RepID=A0A0C5RKQ2_9BACT|nr:hypothetical protein [Ureaplasma diversum]AJQ45233.1 hypothetical protein JM47_01160 [Ureaplasma diversum]
MAGVSVIGVVAACAPTKAKPAKPTEKKVEQPQTSGTESSKQGSGSTTTGTKQGSETGGTTNPSGGSNNTTKGTTQPSTPENPNPSNPGSSDKQEDEKMKENQPGTGQSGGETGKNENPGTNGKENGGSTSETTKPVISVADDAKLIKEEAKYSLTLSVTNADNKYLEVELTEVSTNQENATKVNAKAKVESNSVKVSFDGLKAGTKYKVSTLKLYDSETAKEGVSLELSSTLSGKEFETEAAQTPKVEAPTPTPEQTVSVTLENNAMLMKKDGKYQLSLNVTNADNKYLEVELKKASEEDKPGKSEISKKVKVENGKVVVIFENLEDSAKYKILGAELYSKENDDAENGQTVELNEDLTKIELAIKSSMSSGSTSSQDGTQAKPNADAQTGSKDEKKDEKKITIQSVEYDSNNPLGYTYLVFVVKGPKTLFESIKTKFLNFEFRNSENKYQTDTTEDSGLFPTISKDEGDQVVFKIYPKHPWGKNADFTVTRITLKDKPNENLLANEYKINPTK